MTVEVHVAGRVQVGRLADFIDGVREYSVYAEANGFGIPRVLQGLSGEMNTIRLVYTYPDLAAYEADEARAASDRDYAEAAMRMPFVDGTLRYEVYRWAD